MRKIIIFLIFIIISCSYDISTKYNIDIYGLNINWTYITDEKKYGLPDYWQSPQRSLKDMSGDCEDFHILIAYLIYQNTGEKSDFLYCYDTESKVFHLLLHHNDEYINYTKKTSYLDERYVKIMTYSYDEIMVLAKD